MIVICHSTPLSYLAAMGSLDLLRCFGNIIVPDEVLEEITSNLLIQSNPGFNYPSWIQCHSIENRLAASLLQNHLGHGEAACLVLAAEMNADLVILDDQRAPLQSQSMGFKVSGTIGLLLAEDAPRPCATTVATRRPSRRSYYSCLCPLAVTST